MELRELLARAMVERIEHRYHTVDAPGVAFVYTDSNDDLTAVGIDGDVDLLDLADCVLETMRKLDGTT